MAYDALGTRDFRQVWGSRPDSRFPNNKLTRDVGMSKRITSTAAAFSGSTITDAAVTWSVLKAGDPITIFGSASNNGDHMILTVGATFITVDFPVKTETVSGYTIEIRTL